MKRRKRVKRPLFPPSPGSGRREEEGNPNGEESMVWSQSGGSLATTILRVGKKKLPKGRTLTNFPPLHPSSLLRPRAQTVKPKSRPSGDRYFSAIRVNGVRADSTFFRPFLGRLGVGRGFYPPPGPYPSHLAPIPREGKDLVRWYNIVGSKRSSITTTRTGKVLRGTSD